VHHRRLPMMRNQHTGGMLLVLHLVSFLKQHSISLENYSEKAFLIGQWWEGRKGGALLKRLPYLTLCNLPLLSTVTSTLEGAIQPLTLHKNHRVQVRSSRLLTSNWMENTCLSAKKEQTKLTQASVYLYNSIFPLCAFNSDALVKRAAGRLKGKREKV